MKYYMLPFKVTYRVIQYLIHPHPEQLHHQLPVLVILVFVLLLDLL